MHVPAAHAAPDRSAMLALVAAHPLGLLVSHAEPDGLLADSIPFTLDAGGEHLLGHVARANPVAARLLGGAEVLVVFQGPDHYVSPSWYPSKAVDARVVPTWNYQCVQVRGRVEPIADPEAVLGLLEQLTGAMERPLHGDAHWRVADAPADYRDTLMRHIVAFRLPLAAMQGRWKLSQDKPAANRDGVLRALDALPPAGALAQAMRHPTTFVSFPTPQEP